MTLYRPVSERIKDFEPVAVQLPREAIVEELKRCQDCGVPFCHAAGCPLGNAIPEINTQALAGRWDAALSTLLETSPFPEFTSRICPALCEGSCVQGLYESGVPCREVEYAVIEKGFEDGLIRANPPLYRRGLSAAVVGSGPAGLAAAWKLNQEGFAVTVYERDAKAGGFLRYGIPDFKLEKRVIDRRIALLENEGILFEYGIEAGTDLSMRLLRARHDVLVVAAGSRQSRDLPVPGRDLHGVVFATEYLAAQNRLVGGECEGLPNGYSAEGRKVVVIGGGDTGSDCVGTAWRQGAVSVSQIEIMPQPPRHRAPGNPWPEWPRILRTSSSHEEGCERRWNVTTLEFIAARSNAHHVGGLRCAEVSWTDPEGKPSRPEPIAGSEFILEADMVLLALGFTGAERDTPLLNAGLGMEAGKLRVKDSTTGVYVCGDAASGPGLVVRAIKDGLDTAAAIARNSPANESSIPLKAACV